MRKKYLFLVSLIVASVIVKAQVDVTLPSLRGVYQSSYINPAFTSKYKVSVGLPVISNFYINQTHSGFTPQDVIDSKDKDGYLDLNVLYNKIDADGIALNTTIETDVFHVSIPVGKFQLGFNSTIKGQTNIAIDKNFVGFLTQGNAYFAGQSVDFKAFNIDNFTYLENGLSLARKFSKFSVGARVKYLQGMNAARTTNLRFTVNTPINSVDPMVISTGGTLNTAGLPLVMDSSTGQPLQNINFDTKNLYETSNNGFAFDFGFTYSILPSLTIQASVVDFGGAINWKSAAYNYSWENNSVKFEGLNYDQLNNSDAQTAYTDSLVKKLQNSTITQSSFQTKLATKYFAGIDWDITKNNRLGFLYQGRQTEFKYLPTYTLSYTRKFGTKWDVTGNYTNYSNSYQSYGVGMSLQLAMLQLYIIQDDISIYWRLNKAQIVYLRMGINMVFGNIDKAEKKSKKNKS